MSRSLNQRATLQVPSEASANNATYGDYGYLIATFVGNGTAMENLSLFYSQDGATVVAGGVKNPVYKPSGATYGHRDPSLLRTNGLWYVAQTKNDGTGMDFEVASSPDLIKWTKIATVDCSSLSGVANKIWAPELIQDTNGDVYAFVSAVNGSSVGIAYSAKATNVALTTWGVPVAVSWTTPPANIIDSTFIKNGNTWYCFFKDNAASQINRATASTLTGTYTIDKTGDFAGWGSGVEGPAITKLANGKFRLYMDRYNAQLGYAYTDSADLNTWTALTGVAKGPNFPPGMTVRHGAFYRIKNATEFAQVQAALFAPSMVPLMVNKSVNYTLSPFDEIIKVNGGTGLTMTLPDPTTVDRKVYTIKNTTANAVTVNSAGTSKTIDGAASVSLAQWAAGRYLSDGAVWLTV